MTTDVPSKPGRPDCSDIHATALKLKWKVPDSDGGAEIFNYVVEAREEGLGKWVRIWDKTLPETNHKATGM